MKIAGADTSEMATLCDALTPQTYSDYSEGYEGISETSVTSVDGDSDTRSDIDDFELGKFLLEVLDSSELAAA